MLVWCLWAVLAYADTHQNLPTCSKGVQYPQVANSGYHTCTKATLCLKTMSIPIPLLFPSISHGCWISSFWHPIWFAHWPRFHCPPSLYFWDQFMMDCWWFWSTSSQLGCSTGILMGTQGLTCTHMGLPTPNHVSSRQVHACQLTGSTWMQGRVREWAWGHCCYLHCPCLSSSSSSPAGQCWWWWSPCYSSHHSCHLCHRRCHPSYGRCHPCGCHCSQSSKKM